MLILKHILLCVHKRKKNVHILHFLKEAPCCFVTGVHKYIQAEQKFNEPFGYFYSPFHPSLCIIK